MKPTIAAAAVATVLTLTACGVEPGRVINRGLYCVGRPLVCHFWLKTKTEAGDTTSGRVSGLTYHRCKIGESYPVCAKH
jgi:hypothetical protein